MTEVKLLVLDWSLTITNNETLFRTFFRINDLASVLSFVSKHSLILISAILFYSNSDVFINNHMADIHQEQPSIRNMQVVSSNRVHSSHSCEANKCRIFKPFFLFIR